MIKVLIVDDDQDIRRLLKLFLSRDYILAEASDGLQALEKISCSRFDYVISDIQIVLRYRRIETKLVKTAP